MRHFEAELDTIRTMTKATDGKLETFTEAKLVQSVKNKVIGQVDVQIMTIKEDVSEALE